MTGSETVADGIPADSKAASEPVSRRGLLRMMGSIGGIGIGTSAISDPASAAHLDNTFRGNDNGIYYIRHINGQVFWFGERQRKVTSPCSPLPFANVFRGKLQPKLNIVLGQWWDVPKGFSLGNGSLAVHVNSSTNLSRVAVSGGFGGSRWMAPAPSSLRVPTNFRPAGFTDSQLTGAWTCDDGGTYYIRQLSSDVVWFGENGEVFSSVLFARRSGPMIEGTWVDVPKGERRNSGTIRLRVESSNKISRASATGGFGGSQWSRVPASCLDEGQANIK